MDRAREQPHHLQLFSRQPGIIGILRRRHQESESSESQDPVSTKQKLAVPIIPLSCSCLVCERVSNMDEITGGRSPGLHKLWYPTIRDTSTWSKFGAHGEHGHGDVFLFSNLGAL